MKKTMDTYSARLASAMSEAGLGEPGGQSRLAKAIGCRSQSINQALGGSVLGAIYHVRACMRLGVMPLWLAEGRGPRYDAAGPRAAIPGEEEPTVLHSVWLARADKSGEGVVRQVNDVRGLDLNLSEQAMVLKMRRSLPLYQAITTLVDLADVGRA